ncbi:hypothetical protein Pan54_06820 [Rubinisphaera italica]|uniref:Uncharacterized protein n=1 Tax=Rubinisphaera italica TaxID=2527969 RepID=A0A5C5XC09_9PLAN|nr:hypothetical protein Pan54_06820 [Rubinisphaera italica]
MRKPYRLRNPMKTEQHPNIPSGLLFVVSYGSEWRGNSTPMRQVCMELSATKSLVSQ